MAYYCAAVDLMSRLSRRGYDLRLDDDPAAYADVLRQATNKVRSALLPIYTESAVQADADAGGLVNDLATDVAVYYLCRRRGNTPPFSISEAYREAAQDLDDYRLEMRQLPAVEMRHTPHPAWSNITVDPGYVYRKVRVEMPISEGSTHVGYTRAVDWRSVYFFEY